MTVDEVLHSICFIRVRRVRRPRQETFLDLLELVPSKLKKRRPPPLGLKPSQGGIETRTAKSSRFTYREIDELSDYQKNKR